MFEEKVARHSETIKKGIEKVKDMIRHGIVCEIFLKTIQPLTLFLIDH
jgi:hypothetical protein